MIRKITYFSFAILLLITSAGFSMSKHFCHDQLVEVVIDKQVEPCCGEDGCCHTETTMVQLDDEAVNIAAVSVPVTTVTQLAMLSSIDLLVSFTADPQKEEFIEYISPPPPKIQTVLSNLQTYIL
ncbi:MAG: hypothetical protein ACERKD_06465 [Prolixibacteraceae bacterium]